MANPRRRPPDSRAPSGAVPGKPARRCRLGRADRFKRCGWGCAVHELGPPLRTDYPQGTGSSKGSQCPPYDPNPASAPPEGTGQPLHGPRHTACPRMLGARVWGLRPGCLSAVDSYLRAETGSSRDLGTGIATSVNLHPRAVRAAGHGLEPGPREPGHRGGH